jgi:4-diphosphocytidyl-2-C-methyl-D-erythritol kinase
VTPLSVEAPAKLNLSLRVIGKRADGYHLLESEMVLLELADHLLLLPGSPGLRVEAEPDEEIPLDGSNLAWRGLLAGLGSDPESTCLALEKRIPAAAGLGGGSSDAAAAWRLGRHANGATGPPTEAELASLARLGADVPFFAAGVAAGSVSGIGEVVARLPPPAAGFVVLALPAFRLSTAAVFAELRPAEHSTEGVAGNDLLAPALRLRPELGDLLRLITSAGGGPRLTGSGPTLFTISDDPERSGAVADRLRAGGVRVIETAIRVEVPRVVDVGEALAEGDDEPPGMG